MPEQKITEATRLRPDVYDSLARRMPKPVVTEQTTELQAGFQLGVQYVLTALREGFVTQE